MADPLDRLDAELREAGERWRSAHPRQSTRLDPMLFALGRAPRSYKAFASATGLAVVGLIAVLIVISLPSRNQHVATGSPSARASTATATPAPTPLSTPVISSGPPSGATGTPVTSASGDVVSWHVLGQGDLPGIDGFFGLRTQDGRFLADAFSCIPGSSGYSGEQLACDGERMLLESVDGEHWNQLAHMAGGEFITHFFRGDGYFLASTRFGGLQGDPGPWYSTDGEDWESLAGALAFTGNGCGFQEPHHNNFSPVQLPDGSLMASSSVFCDSRIVSRTWTSVNGRDWTALDPIPVDQFASIKVGFVGSDGSNLWHSPNGVDWQKGDALEGPVAFAAVSDGVVAITSDNSFISATSVIRTSTDGITWTKQAQILHSLNLQTLGSDGLRAVVRDDSDFEPTSGIWVSTTDGATWVRYALPIGEGRPDHIAISGDRVVGLGHGTVGGKDVAMAWTADIPR
jgi:hypothetical protein